MLKKILLAKKHELDQHKTSARSVLSQRIRSQTAANSNPLSAVIAALKSGEDEDEKKSATPVTSFKLHATPRY